MEYIDLMRLLDEEKLFLEVLSPNQDNQSEILFLSVKEFFQSKFNFVIESLSCSIKNINKLIEKGKFQKLNIILYIYFESLMQLGHLDQIFSDLENLRKSIVNSNEIYQIYNIRYHLEKRETLKAIELIKCLENSLDLNSQIKLSEIQYFYAEIQFIQGDYKGAIDQIDKSIEFYKKSKIRKSHARMLFYQAKYCRLRGDFEKSIENLYQTLPIYEELDDHYSIAKSKMFIGSSYMSAWQDKEAEPYLRDAFDYFIQNYHPKAITICTTALCSIYKNLGNYKKALKYGLLGIKQIGNDRSLSEAAIRNCVGLTYKSMNKLEEAELNLLKSYEIVKELNYSRRVSDQANNLASVYAAKGEMHYALKYIEESYELTKKEGNNRIIIDSYQSLAIIYKSMGEYDKSRNFIDQAIKLAINLNSNEKLVMSLNMKIDLLLTIEQFSEIPVLLEKIDVLINDIDRLPSKLEYLRLKANFLSLSNDGKNQREALNLFRELYSSDKPENLDNLILISGLPNYCLVLINEFKNSEDMLLFNELKDHLSFLDKIFKNSSSNLLKIQIHLIYVEIEILKSNISEAISHLKSARHIATNNHLFSYLQIINQRITEIESNAMIWKSLTKSVNNTMQRFQHSRIEEVILNLNIEIKSLLHPVRFSILKLLYYYNSLRRSEICTKLKMISGSLEPHFKNLINQNYISAHYELIDQKPQKIITITPEGINSLIKFKEQI